MKCPKCGKEIKKGLVKIRDGHVLFPTVNVSWCPEEEKGKFYRKNAINLEYKAEGYYCDECMKVFTVFEERY